MELTVQETNELAQRVNALNEQRAQRAHAAVVLVFQLLAAAACLVAVFMWEAK